MENGKSWSERGEHVSQTYEVDTVLGKLVCREFEYRHNLKFSGRTEYILFDTVVFEIIRPAKIERSRTGAHGIDIYCLPNWGDVTIVRLEMSNSGKLKFNVESPSLEVKRDLEELLTLASGFNDMVRIVHMYLNMKKQRR